VRAGAFGLRTAPLVDPSRRLPSTRRARAACPKRHGARPRLAALERFTLAARRAGVPAEALAEFPPAWMERVGSPRPACRTTHRRSALRSGAHRQAARTAAERALVRLRTDALRQQPAASRTRGRSARRVSAGVDRARAFGPFWLPTRRARPLARTAAERALVRLRRDAMRQLARRSARARPAGTRYASSTRPRGRAGRSASRTSAGVDRARARLRILAGVARPSARSAPAAYILKFQKVGDGCAMIQAQPDAAARAGTGNVGILIFSTQS